MSMLLKKIDRVKSVEEAVELQRLGVDLIGISLSEKFIFDDNRVVKIDMAIAIRGKLKKSKLVGEVSVGQGLREVIFLIEEIGLDYVQLVEYVLPSIEFRQELERRGVGIIYSGISVSYDDDPAWILSKYENVSDLNAAFYHLDLLGDMENSWNFLKQESPQYIDEFQIDDIDKIGEGFPLLITLDYTVDNVCEIADRISTARGISMTLGESPKRNNIHCFTYSSVLDVLANVAKCV